MTSTNKILKRITLLYYIFIVVLVVDFAYSFGTGFYEGFSQGQQHAEHLAKTSPYALLIVSIWSLLTVAIYLWAFVLFILLVVSLGKSIAHQNIFNPHTGRFINRYALVYAISIAMMFVDPLIVSASGISMHDVIMNALSGASTIVMLLLFAQVLKIGSILKAETDLTI